MNVMATAAAAITKTMASTKLPARIPDDPRAA